MLTIQQKIVPAARRIGDFEMLVKKKFEYVMMLQIHLSQVKYIVDLAHQGGVKVLLHADLIQGLRPDESGAQFLAQDIRPDGIVSTHGNVVATAKKRGLLAILRIFLLDSHSLETSYRIVRSAEPDYLEVMPGVVPDLIREVYTATGLPILTGGFVRTHAQVQQALAAGAVAVTTSDKDLWQLELS